MTVPEPANLSADSVRPVAWTPSAWQMPAPADGGVAAAASSTDAAKSNYNYFKTCRTVAFNPARHTPKGAGAPPVPAGVDYITQCARAAG